MDVIPINMDALTSIWIERDQKIQAKKNERITHRSLLPDLIFCAFFFKFIWMIHVWDGIRILIHFNELILARWKLEIISCKNLRYVH